METVNSLDFEAFLELFGNVVEHGSLISAAVWRLGPFKDITELHGRICDFMDQLPLIGREAILRVHPDLAGRIAEAGQLTAESKDEQKAAGLGNLTKEERETLKVLNERYKKKFGFPFVVCARLNKKEAILAGLHKRFANELEVEVNNGVEEVKKICLLRLRAVMDNLESKL